MAAAAAAAATPVDRVRRPDDPVLSQLDAELLEAAIRRRLHPPRCAVVRRRVGIRVTLRLAGPWSGSAKALRAIVSGDNFGAVVGDVELVPSERVCVNARQYGTRDTAEPGRASRV